MDYYGYAGTILHVNLSNGEIRREPLPLELAKGFIGGFGLNNYLAYNLLKKGIDPLSADNVILLGAGPLVGTITPGASRIMAVTKLPLLGGIGSASGSMTFAAQLKWAGYDHVVITGKAEAPVYLKISDDDVALLNASGLWGRDINETTDELCRRHGNCGVIAIGPAGEGLVSFAVSLVDKTSTLGRGGFGAVMGSKNLKAILAQGTKGIKVADRKGFLKLVDGLYERMRRYPQHQECVELGLMANWNNYIGQIFTRRNWRELAPREATTQRYGTQVYLQAKKRRMACSSCFIGDKDVLEIKDGELAGVVAYNSSFVNSAVLGARFDIEDFRQAIYLEDLLNRYGLCHQTFNNLVDFLIDLYEHGVITREDTDGLVLRRDFATFEALIEKVVNREGLGDTLAQGWGETLRRIGSPAQEYALLVKGMDFLFDPRASSFGTMEFEPIVSPKGPTGSYGGSPSYVSGLPLDMFRRHSERMGASSEQIERIFATPEGFNVGRLTRCSQDWYGVLSGLGICNRHMNNRFYSLGLCAELYSTVTGLPMSPEEMRTAADRAWNLYKVLNVREGFSRKDDAFPQRWFEPLKTDEGEKGITDYFRTRTLRREDLEQALADYYEERGWDKEKGIPTREKLAELGLGEVAEDLARSGLL